MAISSTAITASNTIIYTSTVASNNVGNAITTMIFCNTVAFNSATPTANQSLLTVYAVPSGQSASTSNMIINQLPIPAGETVSFDQEKMVLENGDKIIAISNNTNLTATISTLAV